MSVFIFLVGFLSKVAKVVRCKYGRFLIRLEMKEAELVSNRKIVLHWIKSYKKSIGWLEVFRKIADDVVRVYGILLIVSNISGMFL